METQKIPTSTVPSTTVTMVDVLRSQVRERPDSHPFIYLVDGEAEEIPLSFRELDHRARGIAAQLMKMGAEGERALLL